MAFFEQVFCLILFVCLAQEDAFDYEILCVVGVVGDGFVYDGKCLVVLFVLKVAVDHVADVVGIFLTVERLCFLCEVVHGIVVLGLRSHGYCIVVKILFVITEVFGFKE